MNQATLHFLSELKQNNHKLWFDEHRKRYESLRKEFLDFIEQAIHEISEIDEKISIIDPKDTVFRINRDIRFSKDKTPYKSNFSSFISSEGRKSSGPGYYIHIEPGNRSMVAAGVYMPEPEKIAKIRTEIDFAGQDLQQIIFDDHFRKIFQEVYGESLSRAPKGYPEDHTYIDLLKRKSFLAERMISDKEIVEGKLLKIIKETLPSAFSFNEFFYRALEN
jgi:uncharacterized protein (TIGR02453 family)